MSQTHDVDTTQTSSGFSIRTDEFEAIRRYLYEETGISLGDAKRDMVSSRLARRLRHYHLTSFGEYLRRVREEDPTGAERQEFINCLTTNKTDFFREPHHFDFLRDTIIPRLRAKANRRVRIWSAGCSSGEEPYTLAMTLREHCPASDGWDVRILASDIDTTVLANAEKGVYDADRIGDVPPDLLRNSFLRGKGANAGKVAVRPELKELITFRQINLIGDDWPVRGKFDAIFCRNVVIYFDRPTQQRLLSRYAEHLEADGHLFLGHSENLHWMADTFAPIGGTVYRLRTGDQTPPPVREVRPVVLQKPAAPPPPPKPKGEEHTIILGDVKATRGPALLKTLLGSCVSACIFDPETGVGGMNHFSLPGSSDDGTSARYGAYAMEMLVTAIMKKGGNRDRLRAKVFGGAKVLKLDSEHLNVGAKNADFVIKYLAAEGIPIDAQCLGGTRGLLVRFHPNEGKALAKPLPDRELPTIVQEEQKFDRELMKKVETHPDDGIELF